MSTAVVFQGKRPAIGKESLAAVFLIVALTFNAGLAVINSHAFGIGRTHVILAEMAVVTGAILLIAASTKKVMLPWLAFLPAYVGFALLIGFFNEYFEPKFVRDIVIIPVFIMLGMLYYGGNIVLLVVSIQAVVFILTLLEMIMPNLFSNIFGVMSYYINTRELTVEAFWNPDMELFVSATRPVERHLLGSLEIHRVSSIFLEPVSLGNYCVIITIIALALWQRLNPALRLFFVGSTMVILIGSDGRLAFVTCLLLVVGYFVFPRLPRYSNVFYLPFTLIVAAFAATFLELQFVEDDFPGRVALSVEMLSGLTPAALLGLSQEVAFRVADSGISYLIATQSVIVAAVLWLLVSFGLHQRSQAAVFYLHGTCLYISLNLLVSYSLFSIKTAALLWFVFGYLQAEDAAAMTRKAGPAPAMDPALAK